MKKFKILFFIALACLLVLPFSVFAEGEEEETTATAESKEVTVYFFRGEGCSHCAEFEAWLDEIEPEYGELFNVVDYETWYNEDNAALMQKVAETRDEKAEGVPYIIIGNKSWNGFAEDYKNEIIEEIKSLYEKEPDERYDVMKYVNKKTKKEKSSTGSDVISLIVIVFVALLIVFGIAKARKNSK